MILHFFFYLSLFTESRERGVQRRTREIIQDIAGSVVMMRTSSGLLDITIIIIVSIAVGYKGESIRILSSFVPCPKRRKKKLSRKSSALLEHAPPIMKRL